MHENSSVWSGLMEKLIHFTTDRTLHERIYKPTLHTQVSDYIFPFLMSEVNALNLLDL